MIRSFHRQWRLALLCFWIFALCFPNTPAYAEPEAPSTGGVFYVDATWDGNNSGNSLTLFEAILLANGGTGPTGLNRPLETSEVVDIKGCNFAIEGLSGNALISSGCGKDVIDTIVVRRNHSLDDEKYDIFHMNSGLPFVNDSQPTIITGEYSAYPVILDFSGDDNTNGLVLFSDNNVLKNITIRGGRCSSGKHCDDLEGLSLRGHGNQVSNVLIHDFQGQGIRVDGDNNVLDTVRVGVPAGNVAKCPLASLPDETTGMSGHGIYLSATAQGTVIKNSVIGCNGLWSNGAGIYVSSGNSGTVIGPNNKIGTIGNGSSVLLGNSSSGVLLNGSQNVTVISNTIGYNGNSGIAVYNGSNSVIGGNLIRDNNVDGITIAAASHNNLIGGPMAGSGYGGNKIGFNNAHGINVQWVPAISLESPTGNRIAGNWVGTLNAVDAAPNQGSGVVLNAAVDTQIGDPAPAAPNIIGGNQGQGIWLRAAAKDNTILNSYVGTNGFTALPNVQNGILIEGGSNDNMIGGLATNAGNLIYWNNEAGVVLSGAGTSSNTLLRNTIVDNGKEGVLITAQAGNNLIGSTGIAAVAFNQIEDNGLWGIAITNGAQNNKIGSSRISGNKRAGIVFDGAATQHNTVTAAVIFENQGADGDGIAQKNGAVNNSWSRISSYDNAGLGIDLEAVTGFNTVTGPVPSITKITDNRNILQYLVITGTATASTINEQTVTVEIYRVSDDPSGYGEGQTFVVSGQTDVNGDFALKVDNTLPGCFTAFQTVSEANSRRSSEFGPNYCMAKSQTITFPSIQDQLVGDPPVTVNPTASSGLPVSVTAEGPCTIDAQKQVTMTGAGTCKLKAQQAGDDTYAPAADKFMGFYIFKKGQSITWGVDGAAQSQFVDAAAFSLNATASSGLPVSFIAEGVCTVAAGMVTLTGQAGVCTLTAQQPGNEMYQPATEVEKSFEVSKKVQSIDFAALPNKQLSDAPFTLSASASSGLVAVITSSTPAVCTVNDNTVTLVNAGSCTLMATQPGNMVFDPAPAVIQSFTVTAAQQTLYLPVVKR